MKRSVNYIYVITLFITISVTLIWQEIISFSAHGESISAVKNHETTSEPYRMSTYPLRQEIAEIDHPAACITFRPGRARKSKSGAGGREGGGERAVGRRRAGRKGVEEEEGASTEGGGCES